ncbi:LOB domain-containing protein 6 isoform X1 [Canna indica]|uniref:LOB domain-containing protein 6 isoform X1 n=1 Tax=Canna indica TaxID=4628 RepID=A0AAQ3JPA4_9LILI|nr:LOB domain-containing protein 6 isoform X1 [Canna indica]
MDNGSGSSGGGGSSSDSLSSAGTATHKRACAACKFQRRRCMPDCILAPFFPAAEQQRFLNAHRLFGVRNMQKMVQALDPEQRAVAMKTIIFESEVHAIDPVGGCHRLILDLESQLQQHLTELDFVNRKLISYRQQAQAMPAASMPHVVAAPPPPVPNSTCSDLTPLGTAAEDASNLMLYGGDAFPAISDDDLDKFWLEDLLMSPKPTNGG